MKTILKIISLVLVVLQGNSQGLTDNGEGQGTVLLKGANISLDLGKTELGFNVNNLYKAVGEKNHGIIGLGVAGESKEGIADLFDKGDISSNTKSDVFFGWSWSNGIVPNIEQRKQELRNRKTFVGEKADQDLEKIIKKNTRDNELKGLQDTLLTMMEAGKNTTTLKERLSAKDDDTAKMKVAKKKMRDDITKLEKDVTSTLREIDSLLQINVKELAKIPYCQFMLFGIGGINAFSFKRFALDTSNYKSSFVNEDFHGGKAGIGANLQYGSFLFGVNYLYEYSHNLNLLDKKEYVLKDVNTKGNQSITEEKKIEAYSGTYSHVEIQTFQFDFIYNLKLDEKGTNHILINPYYRATTFTSNDKILPRANDVGLGLYFYTKNGKFLGGVYGELPDLQDNYEKMKPEGEQNLKGPFKRGSFGIVTKFSFKSLLDLF